MRRRITGLLLFLALALAACSTRIQDETRGATATPSLQPSTPAATLTPWDAPILPPESALRAQRMLADQLGLPAEQVTISAVEAADWPDSCLGLGGAAEICAAVITPGYRIQLTAGGQVYEFRASQEGSELRPVEQADSRRLSEKAAALLAQIAGLKLDEIHFAGLVEMEWPNSCLGVQEAGEACAEVITPGYRVELENGGWVYVLHINADGTAGRLGGPEEMLAALKARQVAAQELNTGLETVRLVTVAAVDWPNSCLGVEKAGRVCLQVITPGYRVTVEAGGQRLEYHTNRDGSSIVR